MIFNSIEFLFIFLPFSILTYYFFLKKNNNLSQLWILFLSIVFYLLLSPIFLIYLIFSIVLNYQFGKLINQNFLINKAYSKLILTFSILLNIFYLGFFKYYNFFSDILSNLSLINLPYLKILLPLGISFYTLQQIMFLVQCYNETSNRKITKDFKIYFLHIIFFPKIIAGPILSYEDFAPQFEKKNIKINFVNLYKGFFLFSIGLFKKVMIADNLAFWNDNGFLNYQSLNFFESWILCFSYVFQLYFDISGYADMAIGISLMLGIIIPINFNSPFKQTNISNLWNCWHMTLTKFINNYIYKPIVFSFKNISEYKIAFAIICTMTIAGLWHGANWNFIVFGLLNGFGIAIYHLTKRFNLKINDKISIFITFTFFSITILFFRVEDLQSGISIVESMFNFKNIVLPGNLYEIFGFLESYNIKFGTWTYSLRGDKNLLFFIALSFYLIFFCENSNNLTEKLKPNFLNCTLIVLLFVISVMFINNSNENIYFQF